MELPGSGVSHAVTVVGVAVEPIAKQTTPIRHRSQDMVAMYVHDDRYGPYLKAMIGKKQERFVVRLRVPNEIQNWTVTHILVPLHVKIRLSFAELYSAGLFLVFYAQAFGTAIGVQDPRVFWKCRISRSHWYLEYLLRDPGRSQMVEHLCQSVDFSRYIGVVRVETSFLGTFDVLLDTTSTERNLNCLAIVQFGQAGTFTRTFFKEMADHFGAVWVPESNALNEEPPEA
jgi:hypothetical protein